LQTHRFRNERGTRTGHHLFVVSKHRLGYDIMKGIMAKESTTPEQGAPSLTYNVADVRFPTLFELARPLDDLESMLLVEKEAILNLENAGRVTCEPPASERQ
jgi:hypothetical protein